MFDLKWIRENPERFDHGLARRRLSPVSAEILALDKEWRQAQAQAEQLQAERNRLSKDIGAAKVAGQEAGELLREVARGREAQSLLETRAGEFRQAIDRRLATIPNLPAEEVPDGADESGNLLVRREGAVPQFDFPVRDHVMLGEALGLMDFARAGKIAGARFVVLQGALASLERALAQFMLDLHTREFGYTEVSPPLLVRDEAAFGTGQLPKFAEDLFRTTDGRWLIPTAEVSLTNMALGQILDEAELPLRLTALTPSFRSEAGASGRDTRGMIRQHQFYKVELVSITAPEQSADEHERMTHCAEAVLKRLELPYRTMLLCTGDMGFSARKTYDLEVWMPSQEQYREISSCSNCGDFQARRMDARCKA